MRASAKHFSCLINQLRGNARADVPEMCPELDLDSSYATIMANQCIDRLRRLYAESVR